METVREMCGDNRFEVIQRAKEHLLEATNIESSPDEMKVLDSFLFRAWQLEWLRKYDPTLKAVKDTKVSSKWVSVDEPPKESGHYWVNIHQKDEGKGEECDFVLDAWYKPNDLLFAPKEVGWTLMNEWHDLTGQMRQYITHWMPVPYPQTPKGDNSNE